MFPGWTGDASPPQRRTDHTKEARRTKEVPGIYYIEVNYSGTQKMKYRAELTQAVGLDCRFDGE